MVPSTHVPFILFSTLSSSWCTQEKKCFRKESSLRLYFYNHSEDSPLCTAPAHRAAWSYPAFPTFTFKINALGKVDFPKFKYYKSKYKSKTASTQKTLWVSLCRLVCRCVGVHRKPSAAPGGRSWKSRLLLWASCTPPNRWRDHTKKRHVRNQSFKTDWEGFQFYLYMRYTKQSRTRRNWLVKNSVCSRLFM